jgi:alpha-beta hydrolase superfamily lysophospholipase
MSRRVVGALAATVAALVILLNGHVRAASARPVSFRTDDGLTLTATWYEASRQPAPAVILLHMLSRTREDWRTFGNQLADAGIHALAVDFRGHGGSGRPAAGAGDLAALVADVRAARAFLLTRSDVVRPGAMGVAGASLGANVAALAAAADPAIRSIALLSPALDYRGLRIAPALRDYGARPALLVAGTNDAYGVRTARELATLGGGVRDVRTPEGGGHGMALLERDADLGRALVDWFQRTLL